MLTAAIGLYLATSPAALAPQDPENAQLQSLSLDALVRTPPRPTFPPIGTFLRSEYGFDGSTDLLASTSREPIQLGDIVDLLQTARMEDIDEGRLSLSVYGTTLLATGQPEGVQAIERQLEGLEAALARPIELTLSVVPWNGADGPGTILDAAATRALLDRHGAVWRGTARTRSGQIQTVGHERWTHFVMDCDVEVAQDSFISDPKVTQFFEGCQFVVEPHALVGSEDLVILGQFAYGQRAGEIASRSTNVKKQPSLDVPDLQIASGTLSGRIADGGSLVVTLLGSEQAGPSVALVLTARWASPPGGAQDRLTMLPISALTTLALQQGQMGTYGEAIDGRPEPTMATSDVYPSAEDGDAALMEPDVLLELLLATTPEDQDQPEMGVAGGHLWVMGNEAVKRRVAALLRSMQDRALVNTGLEVLATTTDTGDAVHRITLPALRDHNHVIVKGREQPVVVDYDVEIAQEAAVANPLVRNAFSGVCLGFRPGGSATGSSIDLLGHWIHTDPLQRRPSESEDVGDLYLPSEARRRLSLNGSITPGQAIDLGSGPVIRLGTGLRSTNVKVILR